MANNVITETESLIRIDMLTRERDAALGVDIERRESEFYEKLEAMNDDEFEQFLGRPAKAEVANA